MAYYERENKFLQQKLVDLENLLSDQANLLHMNPDIMGVERSKSIVLDELTPSVVQTLKKRIERTEIERE